MKENGEKFDHSKEISVRYFVLATLFWALTIGWIIVIYVLSSENSSDSSMLSHYILSLINELLDTQITDDTLLRILAHASEFALLTLFSYMAISFTNKISNIKSYAESPLKIMRSDNEMSIVFTLWFTIINAIADEYHQLFVIGREGTITDVLIDMVGIVIVLAIIRVVFTIYLKTMGKSEVVYT